MVAFVDLQTYSKSLDTSFVAKPRQPVWGDRSITSITPLTIFQYDLITPYGAGVNQVSNPDQEDRLMVGWGMIARVALLTAQDMILTILVDLWNGTFTQIDTSPIAVTANAKVQVVTVAVLPCFHIRGRLQSTGATATVTYHASLTDY